jgi:hypothetical protein
MKRLKFVAKMESGHTPNRQIDAYWIDCTVPWVTLNDVDILNERFGTGLGDVDKLLFDQFEESWVADGELSVQAQNNSIENFRLGLRPQVPADDHHPRRRQR